MARKIPWWEVKTDGKKEQELVLKVLKDNFPNDGNLTTELENKICELLDIKHCIAVTSGTIALYSALKALGIGQGDEVIIPDMTFVATANAVEMSGALPVLADVELETANINPIKIESLITKKTRAVLPVHVGGRPANLKEIMSIAKKHRLIVIEDAAEAFSSRLGKKCLGTFGDLGCFSLSPNKVITAGQGGLIVTNNPSLAKRLREIKDQGSPKRGTAGFGKISRAGYNFKLTNLQAALALGQLNYLKKRITRMKRNYQLYSRYLKDTPGIKLMPFDTENGVIPQWTDAIIEKPLKLTRAFDRAGIGYRHFWPPIHAQKPYRKNDKLFPNSMTLAKKAIWLASAYTLTDLDIKFISDTIKKVLKRK